MKFSLKSYLGRLIWEGEAESTKAAVLAAFRAGADLSGAVLRGADLSGGIPKIPNIDSAILAAVKHEGCALNMTDWHTCGATHCRGGWAIHLTGADGKVLEEVIGSNAAAALIYANSRPSGKVPDFFASTADAMADLEACAAVEGVAP